MKKAYIVLGNVSKEVIIKTFSKKASYFGIEAGCIKLMNLNIPFHAVGDFDSVDCINLKLIEQCAITFMKLPEMKDVTDLEYVLKNVTNQFNEIHILGGISGNRIEHFYGNILLLKKYPNVIIQDENSFITIKHHSFVISKDEYKYINFFALKDITITLEGFKYPLTDYDLQVNDCLCISNELIGNTGKIILTRGSILVIKSMADA